MIISYTIKVVGCYIRLTSVADVAELADALDLGSSAPRACRFDSCHPHISFIDTEADLAQLAERFTSNEEVAGSNPVVGIPCEYSSAGRMLPCHGRGRGSESRCSLSSKWEALKLICTYSATG